MNNQNEWEKEFDRDFSYSFTETDFMTTYEHKQEIYRLIKERIHSLLAQQKQKDREEIKEWAKQAQELKDCGEYKDSELFVRVSDLLDFLSDKECVHSVGVLNDDGNKCIKCGVDLDKEGDK